MSSEWFTQELQDDLRYAGTRKIVPAGEMFIDTEREECCAYIILEGTVRIWASYDPYDTDFKPPVLLDDIDAIDIVGELSVIDGKQPSSFVEAITDSKLIRISPVQFNELIFKHRTFGNHVLENLCKKIRKTNDRLRDTQIFNSNERITREIIRLGQENTHDDNTGFIGNFPRHHILASRCGVTRETVSRAVGTLIRKGVLEREGRSMHIHNLEALASGFNKNTG